MKFNDPIHGTITIPERHLNILRSPSFSRLRNIRQLGFSPTVFLGAVHTRFEHALGKYAVLCELFRQFNVLDEAVKDEYLEAALLEDIGSYPFSHSTAWIFGELAGSSPREIGKRIFDREFNNFYGPASDVRRLAFEPSRHHHEWLTPMLEGTNFSDMHPNQIAGKIDYILRDAFYSGRYRSAFDYTHFKTLVFDNEDPNSKENLVEALSELHRAEHSLNVVYGEPSRRILARVLRRLISQLVRDGLLVLEELLDLNHFIELDDDRFFEELRRSCDRAEDSARERYDKLFDAVTQLRQFDIEVLEYSSLGCETLEALETEIGRRRKIHPDFVFAVNDEIPDGVPYFLMGKKFSTYSEALASDFFQGRTSLINPSKRTGIPSGNYVAFSVID